jgi:type IV secretory pathway TraG/TraD family ATPase VirD4
MGYATVAIPMAVTLFRRTADYGKALASAAVAVPVTIGAGIATAITMPLIHGLGIERGSFLELAAGVGISIGIGYAAGRVLARPAQPTNVHQRGTVVKTAATRAAPAHTSSANGAAAHAGATRSAFAGEASTLAESLRPATAGAARSNASAITLAGLQVAPLDETKHFKIIGTTGTGKSTAIRELLAGALNRGDRAIIADPDGGYLNRFRDPARGDLVLNPFEPESRKWDLFGEIHSPYDIDQLARSLLPDQGGPDRSWINYARTFFSSVTRQAHEAGITDMRELYRLLVVADAKELRGLLAGTPAQPFLEEHNGRMFDSIRSVTSSAVGSLDYIAQQTAEPLSIRQWVRREDNESGVLFIPYKAGQIASLRSTISAWMRLAIFEAMNQPEGDQRLWFVVDELDALGQIDGLKDALARLRKFGGRGILGFQSIAQVSGTYGSADAQTITENCGNTLILRCSGSDHGGTANFASRLIGQREVLRINKSRSRRPGELLSSITLSEHVGIEPAVMDSQIEQLPDLAGYLKFASVPNWQQVALTVPNPPDSGRTRDEARSNWQRWRTDHAADVATPRASTTAARDSFTANAAAPAVSTAAADGSRADATESARAPGATTTSGAATATRRATAGRATIDYGPVMTPDGAEYE